MSVPSRYLGNFTHARSDGFVTVRLDPYIPYCIQYRYTDSLTWHRLDASQWYPQVDDGTWVPDVPEYMRVSEGL